MKLPPSTHRKDRAPSKLRGRETEQHVETTVVWKMGVPKLRHSTVKHRRGTCGSCVNKSGSVGEDDCMIGEDVERELVLVVSVRCGKQRDMTRG